MIKALIVDDEPAVAAIIKHFIERESIPVEIVDTASNGKQALEYIKKYSPQLVFLDIQMPLLNGFEVMQAAPGMRYIIITAYESFDYAQQALRLGAKDILLKPIEHKQFLQAITRAIGWQFTSNEMINQVLEYINNSYAEKIELNQLAGMFYVTPSHIARLFKKNVGMSIITYVHKVRIDQAVRLMETGQYTIQTIAELVGYSSLNNFYKHFKEYTGLTPAAYHQRQISEQDR